MTSTDDVLAEIAKIKAEQDEGLAEIDADGLTVMPFGRHDDGGLSYAKASFVAAMAPTFRSMLMAQLVGAFTAGSDADMRHDLLELTALAVSTIQEIDRRSGDRAEVTTKPTDDTDSAFAEIVEANFTPDEKNTLKKTEEVYTK